MKQHNVVVIGAGYMGSKKDTTESRSVYTHGKAFSQHDGFKLVGFVDTDKAKADMAAYTWGGMSFDCIDDAYNFGGFRVAAIATPDDTHYNVLRQLLRYPIRAVFCEKPLCLSLEQAKELEKEYKKEGIITLVNHTRRFMPELQELREKIITRTWGNPLFSVVYYGNGLVHDGIHAIDLLLWLGLDPKQCKYTEIPSSFYRIFEIDMFFEQGRIRLTDFSWRIEEYGVETSPYYRWQQHLTREHHHDTLVRLDTAMTYAVNHLHDCIQKKTYSVCSFADAVNSLEIAMDIQKRSDYEEI